MKKAEIKPNTVYRVGGYGPDYILTGDDPFVVTESRARSWKAGTKVTKVTGQGFYLSTAVAQGYTKTPNGVERVLGQVEFEVGSLAAFKRLAKEKREQSLNRQAQKDDAERRIQAVIATLNEKGIGSRRTVDRFSTPSIEVSLANAEKIVEALS